MATGQLATAASARPSFRLDGVPVLLYHALGASERTPAAQQSKYWVALSQFREQLNQIVRSGRRVALLGELWRNSGDLSSCNASVVLTFDDGQASDYELAFPTLLEAGVRADFFVNTATVGECGFLTWAQMVEMQRAGMGFHSHSHDHVALSRLAPGPLERQLQDSKRLLEDRLGQPVDFLAVPYGLLNRRVVQAAREAGYRAVCMSRPWPVRPRAVLMGRVAVYRHTTSYEFDKLLAGDPLWYAARALRDIFLYLPKQVLLRYRPAQLGVRVLENQA